MRVSPEIELLASDLYIGGQKQSKSATERLINMASSLSSEEQGYLLEKVSRCLNSDEPQWRKQLAWQVIGHVRSSINTGNTGNTYSLIGQPQDSVTAPLQQPPSDPLKSLLRDWLTKRFDFEELKTLCRDMGINPENVAGDTLEGFVRELIDYATRRGAILQLIELGLEVRQN